MALLIFDFYVSLFSLDSVMNLTILSAGTSIPEAVSSVIMTSRGYGSMGISNSIGSNIFNILLCLGLPWLIKTLINPTNPGQPWVSKYLFTKQEEFLQTIGVFSDYSQHQRSPIFRSDTACDVVLDVHNILFQQIQTGPQIGNNLFMFLWSIPRVY